MELTLIDDQPRPKSTLGYSFVIHVAGVALAIMVPFFMTDVIKAPEHHYSVISLVTPRPIPKMAAPKVKLPPPKLVVNRQELPKLTLPKIERPAPAPPVLAHFDSPKILPSPPQNSLPRLVPSVHTGVLTGSSAPATVKAPVRKVQTGGFGDPNGLAPSSNSKGDGKLMMARLGNFDLPPGPGYGNGSGGAHGIRGTVASAGFGNSIAGPGQGGGQSGSSRGGGIHASGFEQAQVQETPKPRATPTAGPTKPVEITYKPNPIYTDEARALKLEGDVLLDVIFAANGQIQILHVARGLGHGLDEAAVRSAQQIRFKPAMRDGQPVDSEATLHVRFQLAY